jgi:hypothetical protein
MATCNCDVLYYVEKHVPQAAPAGISKGVQEMRERREAMPRLLQRRSTGAGFPHRCGVVIMPDGSSHFIPRNCADALWQSVTHMYFLFE